MRFFRFLRDSVQLVLRGTPLYYGWMLLLAVCVVIGAMAYGEQMRHGLIVTHMRDPVSWGFYIGNFTFLVGVAAAAVVLVIPAYVYHWEPIKEVVVIGELLAISAIIMCMLFVMADLGHPERFLYVIPVIGSPNFPRSLLSWDVLVLNLYLGLNFIIATHVLYRAYTNRKYSKFVWPLIILSIPTAVGIHTVTAFLYNGLASRPFWNSAILAPRFLTSAFCSGPAIILIVLQILRRATTLRIRDEALQKIAELMAYAMALNLFMLGAEVYREYYSNTHHLLHYRYLFTGVGAKRAIVPYAWASVLASVVAFVLFVIPRTRRNLITLNIGAILIYFGVYIEKGVALVVPGFTPSQLGEIYEYSPSSTEIRVSMGIFGLGFMLFTAMLKVAVPILNGRISIRRATSEVPIIAVGGSVPKPEPAAGAKGSEAKGAASKAESKKAESKGTPSKKAETASKSDDAKKAETASKSDDAKKAGSKKS